MDRQDGDARLICDFAADGVYVVADQSDDAG
jgi:hypothetical protein